MKIKERSDLDPIDDLKNDCHDTFINSFLS